MVRPTSSGDQSDMATEEDLARHFKSPSPPPCSPPPSISMVPYYQGSGQSPMDKLLQNRQQSVSMAAPTNSEESEMATEEYLIYWNSPSPSSNSMVVYYQASGQSPMDNPLQNRQQQSGEWESDEAIEESEGMTGPGFYFPPSPTDFPPLPTTFPPSSPSFPPSLSPPRRSLSNSRAVSVSNTISITIATQNQQHKDIIGAYLNENPTDLFVGAFNVGKGGPFDLKKPRNSLSAAARHREKVSERIRFLKELVPGATKTDRAGNLDMAINYVQSLQRQVEFLSMKLETFNLMNALNAGLSTQTRADWGYGIHKWPPHNEHKFDGQSHPNGTPVVVDREEIPQLNSDTLRSLQALVATPEMNNVLMKELMSRSCHNKTPAAVDQEGTNNVHVNEITMPQFSPTVRQENLGEDFGNDIVEIVGIRGEGTREGEMEEGQLNYGCLNEGIRNVKIPAEDRGNKKATGVRIAISLEDILQTKAMSLKDAANHLNVSRSRWPPHDEHKLMRQSLPDEIPAIVDQEGILQLIENHVPSNQPMTATIDTNSVFKEIPPPQFLPTARQENRDENFATDEIEVIGMGGVGTGEGEMEVGQLNSRCSSKGKRIENTSRGGRGNNKTTGVRIAIPLEDILQTKEMRLKDAAKHLNVSRSTLKRACREYNIYRWPPREELKLLSQYSLPNKFPTVVDQEQIPQLNDATLLPSNQVPTTVNTNSTVTVKARIGKETIKFRLSWPWGTVELKQQVKKRLELEDGAYYIRYKDEDGELILIACDDDLKDCISSSSPLGSKSIEILLEPK